jgi:hypothetical protein
VIRLPLSIGQWQRPSSSSANAQGRIARLSSAGGVGFDGIMRWELCPSWEWFFLVGRARIGFTAKCFAPATRQHAIQAQPLRLSAYRRARALYWSRCSWRQILRTKAGAILAICIRPRRDVTVFVTCDLTVTVVTLGPLPVVAASGIGHRQGRRSLPRGAVDHAVGITAQLQVLARGELLDVDAPEPHASTIAARVVPFATVNMR